MAIPMPGAFSVSAWNPVTLRLSGPGGAPVPVRAIVIGSQGNRWFVILRGLSRLKEGSFENMFSRVFLHEYRTMEVHAYYTGGSGRFLYGKIFYIDLLTL